MNMVISEFAVGRYKVLVLDELNPAHLYRKYLIDGIIYEPVPVHDMSNCIAIESEKSFVRKSIVFIK